MRAPVHIPPPVPAEADPQSLAWTRARTVAALRSMPPSEAMAALLEAFAGSSAARPKHARHTRVIVRIADPDGAEAERLLRRLSPPDPMQAPPTIDEARAAESEQRRARRRAPKRRDGDDRHGLLSGRPPANPTPPAT